MNARLTVPLRVAAVSATSAVVCAMTSTIAFPIHSAFAFIIFHGLVWSSFAVIAGVMLAIRRRMRDE